MGDSNSDGTIVNPGAQYEPTEGEVGDAVDEANDLRFSEEQRLIQDEISGNDEAKPKAS